MAGVIRCAAVCALSDTPARTAGAAPVPTRRTSTQGDATVAVAAYVIGCLGGARASATSASPPHIAPTPRAPPTATPQSKGSACAAAVSATRAGEVGAARRPCARTSAHTRTAGAWMATACARLGGRASRAPRAPALASAPRAPDTGTATSRGCTRCAACAIDSTRAQTAPQRSTRPKADASAPRGCAEGSGAAAARRTTRAHAYATRVTPAPTARRCCARARALGMASVPMRAASARTIGWTTREAGAHAVERVRHDRRTSVGSPPAAGRSAVYKTQRRPDAAAGTSR